MSLVTGKAATLNGVVSPMCPEEQELFRVATGPDYRILARTMSLAGKSPRGSGHSLEMSRGCACYS
jgi:hypothetical protein